MKVLVVEDHTLVRELVVWACTSLYPNGKVEEASDAAAAVVKCRDLLPELILLDLVLPDRSGIELLPDLLKIAPAAKVIALSSHTDEVTLLGALRANVHGFVDKGSQSIKVLQEAIATVMDGRQYLSPVVRQVKASVRNDPKAFDKLLSEREQQILGLIGQGMNNDDIGARLGIKGLTIHSHRQHIMSKLGIHSTAALILYAIEKGFTRIRQTSGVK